jgi:hypothetical protein
MLDILLKQMELQDVEQHQGISTQVCESVSRLLKCMVTATSVVGPGSHVCCNEKVRWFYWLRKKINSKINLDGLHDL